MTDFYDPYLKTRLAGVFHCVKVYVIPHHTADCPGRSERINVTELTRVDSIQGFDSPVIHAVRTQGTDGERSRGHDDPVDPDLRELSVIADLYPERTRAIIVRPL